MFADHMTGGLVLAAAPSNIPSTLRSGIQSALSQVCTGTFATLLKVIGGLLIAGCLLVLFWKYVSPQSQMFASMGQGQGGKRVGWIIAFLLLGLCLIAPVQILPWVGAAVGLILQLFANIVGILTGA